MNRDHKIEKINAYRKLLTSGKIPKVDEADPVSTQINEEFHLWVERQLKLLLGEESEQAAVASNITFSDEEVEILKSLAAGVKARRQVVASSPVKEEATEAPKRPIQVPRPARQPQTPREDPTTLSAAERERLNSTARPLGNRRMAEALKANTNDALASALDRMDNEGPEY